jgi:HlyD family secretion protein
MPMVKAQASPIAATDLVALTRELDIAFPVPPIRRALLVATVTLLFGLCGLVAWSLLATIDRAVIAEGVLVAESRRKSVTLLEAGILREMVVHEGDRVRAGQVLLRLDVTQAEATANQARAQYWGGMAHIARLSAEQADSRNLAMPAEVRTEAERSIAVGAVIASEEALFAARWEAYDGSVQVQQRQIAQLEATLRGIPEQRRAVETQLQSMRGRIAGFAELARSGVGSRFRVMELQEAEAGLVGSIAQMNATEASSLQSIGQARSQLAQIRLTRLQEIATDLQATQVTVAQAEQQLRAAAEVLRRREVTAPEDGIVTAIQFVTPGSAIGVATPVMELLPPEDRLIIETHVHPDDVEQLSVGQRVNARLTAFRRRDVPLVPGRVIYVSADRQTEGTGATAAAYYVARAALDPAALAALPADVRLGAGMPVETYFIGERRIVADFIIRPLRDAARRGLRE